MYKRQGIPFDCGTHPFRVGSRQGPDAIREQSRLLRPVDIFRRHGIHNPPEFLRVIDVGNVACHPGDPDASYPLIAVSYTHLDVYKRQVSCRRSYPGPAGRRV